MKVRITAIILALVTLLSLSACGDGGEPVNAAIVYGAHSNAPAPDIPGQVTDLLREAAYSGGSVNVVTAEGEPFYNAIPLEGVAVENLSTAKKQSIVDEDVEKLVAYLSTLSAKSPEVDLLRAIDMAARSVAVGNGSAALVILDPGLPSAGLLDLTQMNWLDAETDTLLQYLRSESAVPELEDIDVYWYGMGTVRGKQESLPPKYRTKLEERWTAILKEGGAKSIRISPSPVIGEEPEGLPEVTPVTFPVTGENAEAIVFSPVVLQESVLNFLPDSTDFVDEQAAMDALRPLAEAVRDHHIPLLLAGTTATVGENQDCCAFSLGRAKKVRELLLELGAEEEIRCVGLGYVNPYHVPDLDASGGLIEVEAAKNRSVIAMDLNSESAGELLSR